MIGRICRVSHHPHTIVRRNGLETTSKPTSAKYVCTRSVLRDENAFLGLPISQLSQTSSLSLANVPTTGRNNQITSLTCSSLSIRNIRSESSKVSLTSTRHFSQGTGTNGTEKRPKDSTDTQKVQSSTTEKSDSKVLTDKSKDEVLSNKKNAEKESIVAQISEFDAKAHIDKSIKNSRIVAQMNQGIKHVAHELNIGDQLAVVTVITAFVLLFIVPYMVIQMKKSASTYEDLAIDDPVDNFTKLARQEWGILDEDGDLDGKTAVELMLRDVMKSKALQDTALDFVIRIFEAPEFKESLNRLVQELWKDLVNDPETVNQVINLLNVAIQDARIQKSAQKLVLNLTENEEVKAALVAMLQRIGQEEKVLEATQTLLTNSTHRTLNDSEVLEHSMEFASDVVGDDGLQQTAREALWNTVNTAFRPALTIFLTASGIGLIVFGIVSIGFARSSEQEARLMERAARSLHMNAAHGLGRIITWPHRALSSTIKLVLGAVFAPVRALHNAALGGVGSVYKTMFYYGNVVMGLPVRLVQCILDRLTHSARATHTSITTSVGNATNAVSAVVSSLLLALSQRMHSARTVIVRVGNENIVEPIERIRQLLEYWLHCLRSGSSTP